MKDIKAKLGKFALLAGLATLSWVFDVGGVRGGQQGNAPASAPEANARQSVADVRQQATAAVQQVTPTQAPKDSIGISPDGEYDSRDEVAAYIRKFGGRLPKNYITKEQARELGWQGGPLEPYAPGKSIGGDHFGNYEHRLPNGRYRECDIATRGKSRGGKRLIFTTDGRTIYYTDDHYETFRKLEEK